MSAYYNEIDPYAAQWLRNLITAGHIAPGEVDERSIEDVRPDDLVGYTQCHFFAGIGGWSYALRLAGWPDDKPAWTGSCPCQPFSAAGARAGTNDARHLWPAFRWLIDQCRPPAVFGEQVASKDGRAWFSGVRTDLEALGYAVGGADLCAAGIGAPHIRQRLWFVGLADTEIGGFGVIGRPLVEGEIRHVDGGGGTSGGLADAGSERRQQVAGSTLGDEGAHGWRQERDNESASDGEVTGRLADTTGGFIPVEGRGPDQRDGAGSNRQDVAADAVHGGWSDADWLLCRDGKWRPVEPGTFPLAHGVPGRVGQLRAYGNAIVPPLAAAFILAAGTGQLRDSW